MLIKKIVIIKPDHIGDYVLFRPFIKALYFHFHERVSITLVVNDRLKDLAPFLDSKYVEKFVFINLAEYLNRDWHFTIRNLELLGHAYDMVINSMASYFHSIESLISDLDSLLKYRIFDSNSNCIQYQNDINKIYTDCIDVTDLHFEFEKQQRFIESIVKSSLAPVSTKICLQETYKLINNDYVLVFIGADDSFRKWDVIRYAKVIKYIFDQTDLSVILCGGTNEIDDSIIVESFLQNSRLHNLVNKTTLVDLCYILDNAVLVISNETGAAHLSTGLGVNTLVISNGNHFGRFTPYPVNMANNYKAIYPFSNDLEMDYAANYYKFHKKSRLDINLIDEAEVLYEINSMLADKFRKRKAKQRITNSIEHLVQSKIQIFSDKQINKHLSFSKLFSELCCTVESYKITNQTYIVYGDGYLGKVIRTLLQGQYIGTIDIKEPNSFTILDRPYDSIIISVLGRENEISESLVNEYNVSAEKIIRFKLEEAKYIERTK